MGLGAVGGGGAGGDKERMARLKRIKQLKDSGGNYENLLNEVRCAINKMPPAPCTSSAKGP